MKKKERLQRDEDVLRERDYGFQDFCSSFCHFSQGKDFSSGWGKHFDDPRQQERGSLLLQQEN